MGAQFTSHDCFKYDTDKSTKITLHKNIYKNKVKYYWNINTLYPYKKITKIRVKVNIEHIKNINITHEEKNKGVFLYPYKNKIYTLNCFMIGYYPKVFNNYVKYNIYFENTDKYKTVFIARTKYF